MNTASPSEPIAKIDLRHDPWGRLILVDAAGAMHEGVTVVRAFPITDPRRMVSIVSASGHELLLVPELAALPTATRTILEQELARREFLPIIHRITKVSGRIEPCEWYCDTDRGPHKFVLTAYENVHRLADHRALVIDGEGIRYLIPDIRALDAASRAHLDRYL